jgi:hypothetical protein
MLLAGGGFALGEKRLVTDSLGLLGLFGFAKEGSRYWLPHALMGTTEVLVALMSKTR